MTIDAMNWVWDHSQSKGNTRLALLAVANQSRTPACEVQLSYSDFMAAMNATRSAVRDSIRAAENLGELVIVTPGKGTRKALYRLPKAVGYVRPSPASGSTSEPLEASNGTPSGSTFQPLAGQQDHASGSNSDPERFDFPTTSGSNSDPHSPFPSTSTQEGGRERGGPEPDYGIPRNVRPLIDAMTRAGLGSIRWPFEGNQWFPIEANIQKSGIDAMVDFAVKAASRTSVESAKFFLPGWRQLPPLPNGWQPPPRDSPPPPKPAHCGDIDCDASTRLREIEDTEGLPVLVPCKLCHPQSLGARP